VSLLLTLEGLAELLATVLDKSDGLMAASCLNVLFAEHVTTLVKVLNISFEGSVKFVDLLIDHTHLSEDACDLRMVLANTVPQDIERAVQVLEALSEVANVVIVHR